MSQSKRELSQNVTRLSGIPLKGLCDVIACVIAYSAPFEIHNKAPMIPACIQYSPF